jgi:hypothetical protein
MTSGAGTSGVGTTHARDPFAAHLSRARRVRQLRRRFFFFCVCGNEWVYFNSFMRGYCESNNNAIQRCMQSNRIEIHTFACPPECSSRCFFFLDELFFVRFFPFLFFLFPQGASKTTTNNQNNNTSQDEQNKQQQQTSKQTNNTTTTTNNNPLAQCPRSRPR